MKEYNLSPEDLGFGSKRKPMKMVRRPVAPKYRNTTTGDPSNTRCHVRKFSGKF
jgi:hypothetical protein